MAGAPAGFTAGAALGRKAGAAAGASIVAGAESGASTCASPKLLLAADGASALPAELPAELNTTCCVLPKTGLVLLTVVLRETAALCCTAWETALSGPDSIGAPTGTALAPVKSWD